MSKRMKLCDCCLSIADGDHMPPPKANDGIPFVTISDITSTNKIDFSNTMFVPRKYWDKIDSKRKPQVGDILYSVTGSYGVPVYVDFEKAFVFQRHIAILRPNPEIIDGPYLYYILKNPAMLKLVDKLVTGAIQKTLGLEMIRNIEIDVPPICEQHKLVSILQEIDAKIDTNNAICAELEAIAKLLYDYWFVQFDFPDENGKPYKSSGGKMVWSEELKREIPEGWNAGNLYNIADFINGLACQKFRPEVGGKSLPVIKIGEMHDGITEKTERVRADIPQKNIIHDGDILFSWSATLEAMIWTGGIGGLNQHIFKVVPKLCSKHYVYQQLSAYILNFVKMAEARKTTMGHITTDHLKQSKIALPPNNIVALYEEKVESIYSMILTCRQENRSLASLRDFLLPLLMNGQVVINSDE